MTDQTELEKKKKEHLEKIAELDKEYIEKYKDFDLNLPDEIKNVKEVKDAKKAADLYLGFRESQNKNFDFFQNYLNKAIEQMKLEEIRVAQKKIENQEELDKLLEEHTEKLNDKTKNFGNKWRELDQKLTDLEIEHEQELAELNKQKDTAIQDKELAEANLKTSKQNLDKFYQELKKDPGTSYDLVHKKESWKFRNQLREFDDHEQEFLEDIKNNEWDLIYRDFKKWKRELSDLELTLQNPEILIKTLDDKKDEIIELQEKLTSNQDYLEKLEHNLTITRRELMAKEKALKEYELIKREELEKLEIDKRNEIREYERQANIRIEKLHVEKENSLQQRINELEKQFQEYIHEEQEKLDKLHNNLENQLNDIEDKKRQIELLKAQIKDEAQKKLLDIRAREEDWRRKVEDATNWHTQELARLTKEHEDTLEKVTQERVNELEKIRIQKEEEHKEELAQITKDYLNQKLNEMKEKNSKEMADFIKLKDQELAELRKKELEKIALETEQEKAANLKQHQDFLKQKEQEAADEIAKKQQQFEAAKQAFIDEQGTLQQCQEQIKVLTEQLAERKRKSTELKQCQDNVIEQDNQIKELKAQIAELKTQSETLKQDQQKADCKKYIDEISQGKVYLKQEIEKLGGTWDPDQDIVDDIGDLILLIEGTKTKLKDKHATEIDGYKKEISRLSGISENEQKEIAEKTTRLQTMQEKLDKITKDLSTAQSQNLTHSLTIQTEQNFRDEVAKILGEKSSRISNLTKKIKEKCLGDSEIEKSLINQMKLLGIIDKDADKTDSNIKSNILVAITTNLIPYKKSELLEKINEVNLDENFGDANHDFKDLKEGITKLTDIIFGMYDTHNPLKTNYTQILNKLDYIRQTVKSTLDNYYTEQEKKAYFFNNSFIDKLGDKVNLESNSGKIFDDTMDIAYIITLINYHWIYLLKIATYFHWYKKIIPLNKPLGYLSQIQRISWQPNVQNLYTYPKLTGYYRENSDRTVNIKFYIPNVYFDDKGQLNANYDFGITVQGPYDYSRCRATLLNTNQSVFTNNSNKDTTKNLIEIFQEKFNSRAEKETIMTKIRNHNLEN